MATRPGQPGSIFTEKKLNNVYKLTFCPSCDRSNEQCPVTPLDQTNVPSANPVRIAVPTYLRPQEKDSPPPKKKKKKKKKHTKSMA